ncbi:MAG TPA: chemotaxis protein CheW [Chthonomonadaceae bacterium]|nr:chemotaxis protein CheW [Chthonomonadaceae bacterium]
MSAVMDMVATEEQLVAFRLAGEVYGVDIALIHEIIRLCEITQIPRTAPEIEGVVNLRGKIVPIMDLRQRLGLPSAERNSQSRIIVLQVDDCTVGAVVDSVIGVLRISQSQIEPPSQLVTNLDTDTIRGVGKNDDQIIILLNMHKVLKLEA